MTQFQWDTDDDFGFDNSPQPNEQPPKRRLWRWASLGLLLLLVAVVGFFVNRRINETVETVTAETEAELRATFGLLFERSAENDLDLFPAMLSGTDRNWSAAQQLMMGADGILDRSALGLSLNEPIPELADLWLSPDLKSAEITATTTYTAIGGETVTFDLPVTFRQGTELWIYSPPRIEYWGETITDRVAIFEVVVPERDAELAVQLATDMFESLTLICENGPSLCPENEPKIVMEFSADARILAELTPASVATRESLRFVLPTPTLVGLPTDEAAYAALHDGYLRQILPPLIADWGDYDCCDKLHFVQPLIEEILVQTGLPYQSPRYVNDDETFDTILTDRAFDLVWRNEDGSAQSDNIARAIVHLIVTEYDYSPAEWLQTIAAENPFRFSQSLNPDVRAALQEEAGSVNDVLHGKLVSSYLTQSGIADSPSSMSLPTQFPPVACNVAGEGATIYAVNPSEQRWTPIYEETFAFAYAETAPNGDGYIMQHFADFEEGEWPISRIYWLRGDERILIEEGQSFASGIEYSETLFLNDVQGAPNKLMAVDLAACSAESCPKTSIPLVPQPSPDQSLTLFHDSSRGTVTVKDSADQTIFENVGFTTGPVSWLNNEQFLYHPSRAFVPLVQSITGDAIQPLFSPERLLSWLEMPLDANLISVTSYPLFGDGVLYYGVTVSDEELVVEKSLKYDVAAQTAIVLDGQSLQAATPDGKALLFANFLPLEIGRAEYNQVELHRISDSGDVDKTIVSLGGLSSVPQGAQFHTTEEGSWVISPYSNFLKLFDMDTEESMYLLPPVDGCELGVANESNWLSIISRP